MTSNVFSALSKYGSRQPENYLTESFVYLLDLISRRSPADCVGLLELLLGINLGRGSLTPLTFECSTQVFHDDGVPDIEIQISDSTRALIEVKHDARFGKDQLEDYKRLLERSPHDQKALVLLTRSKYSAIETSLGSNEYHQVCYYEVDR